MEDQAEYITKRSRAENAALKKYAAIQKAAEDKIGVQKIYIDMTGDIAAAFILDEIIYFTLPRGNGKSALRVWKDGYLWMAVQRADWWERKRLTPRQADTAINKLEALKLIVKSVHKFNGQTSQHLRLNVPEFFRQYGETLEKSNPAEDEADTITRDISDLYEMMGELQNGELQNGELQNGELQNGETESPKCETELQNGDSINTPHQPSPTYGANAPKTDELPIEWQIAGRVETVTLPDETHARRVDFANLVAMGTPNPPEAYMIAMAFQDRRDITMPESKVKGQRRAIKEMLEMGVTAEHVRQAVGQLMDKGMTVADFYSVSKTAIDLANKPQKEKEYTRLL